MIKMVWMRLHKKLRSCYLQKKHTHLPRYDYQTISSLLLIVLSHVMTSSSSGLELRHDYACFNTLFTIACSDNEMILFQSARYGRNNSMYAARCDMPYTRSCDVDVHFPLNRACAGRQRCSIAVNTGFFGDPCGYEEFLTVSYHCVPVTDISSKCYDASNASLRQRGYIASPNYPGNYIMDHDCYWKLTVSPWQTLRLTVLDFELDVKRGGRCYDVVTVSGDRRQDGVTGNHDVIPAAEYDDTTAASFMATADSEEYFRDCGALGKQTIELSGNRAVVRFKTGRTSITQRGFVMYFEAVGPECAELEIVERVNVTYYTDHTVLYANVACNVGYYMSGGNPKLLQTTLQCLGSTWSGRMPRCLAGGEHNSVSPNLLPSPPLFDHSETISFTPAAPTTRFYIDKQASIFGIGLGVLACLILLASVAVILHYCNRRRYSVKRKVDKWTRGVVMRGHWDNQELHDISCRRRGRSSVVTLEPPVSSSVHYCRGQMSNGNGCGHMTLNNENSHVAAEESGGRQPINIATYTPKRNQKCLPSRDQSSTLNYDTWKKESNEERPNDNLTMLYIFHTEQCINRRMAIDNKTCATLNRSVNNHRHNKDNVIASRLPPPLPPMRDFMRLPALLPPPPSGFSTAPGTCFPNYPSPGSNSDGRPDLLPPRHQASPTAKPLAVLKKNCDMKSRPAVGLPLSVSSWAPDSGSPSMQDNEADDKGYLVAKNNHAPVQNVRSEEIWEPVEDRPNHNVQQRVQLSQNCLQKKSLVPVRLCHEGYCYSSEPDLRKDSSYNFH